MVRWLDVRRGETAAVTLSFAYVAVVVASFLLAKPIRNGLFLQHYGPYALVYVYAAVPLALTLFVPVTTRLAARFGQRTTIIASLWFFCANVVLFWVLFRFAEIWVLPAVLYVWVNCFGVIAPVQAWTFVSSLFDTRQAKRLFGLVGAGASFGGMAGGLLGRLLVGPVGGTVNLLLVLAGLIAVAATLVTTFSRRTRTSRGGRGVPEAPPAPASRDSFADSLVAIARWRYLRLTAAMVFLVAIATQWVAFQLSLHATARFAGNADQLTSFYSSFNFYLGLAAFLLQIFVTGRVLRRFGLTVSILLLPLSLLGGSALILVLPVLWAVLVTAGLDQGLRFSIDKASYELLYLPLSVRQRSRLKAVIDIVVARSADAIGAILLGVATRGFFGLGGFGLGVRGTAAINMGLIALWSVVAWRLRSEYVVTIGQSIRSHRLEAERVAAAPSERHASHLLDAMLASENDDEVRYALSVLEAQPDPRAHPLVPRLLRHRSADIRCRALRRLNESGAPCPPGDLERLVADEDLATRTEALLYLSRHTRTDPIAAVTELHQFPGHSVRASIAAFLASPGPAQNVEAARVILDRMISEGGPDGLETRREAARLVEVRPEVFRSELISLLSPPEEDPTVLRHAIRAAGRLSAVSLAPLLILRLASDVAEDAFQALARMNDEVLPHIRAALHDPKYPLEVRRALPGVLARLASPSAEALLVDALLQSDAGLRHRIIASLNKLHASQPHLFSDTQAVELVLAAEIMGHYRSYQVLAALSLRPDRDEIGEGMRQAMDQELERIFRLIALVMPGVDLHSAYVALSADDRTVRANAVEFLETSLKPDLARLLMPLIDPQVALAERVRIADRLVGASVDSVDVAIDTLLASEDSWLRQTAHAARARLWEPEAGEPAPDTGEEAQPAALGAGL